MSDGLIAFQIILLIGGAVIALVCWIMLIAAGGRVSPGWGWLIFLFNIVAIPAFELIHWPAARKTFLAYCTGIGCFFTGFSMLAFNDFGANSKPEHLVQIERIEAGEATELSSAEQAAIYQKAANDLYYDHAYQKALPLAQKAFALEAGHSSHETLGRIYTELGDYERGVYHLERSLEGQYFVSGYTLEDLAKAHMGRRNIARAWELYKRACGTGLESACRRVYQTPSSR